VNELGQLIAQAEQMAQAEAKAADNAERAKLIETLESIDAQLRAMNEKPPPRLTRGGMSALEKSRFIEANGASEYMKLPWS
jgi:hypothetical protein